MPGLVGNIPEAFPDVPKRLCNIMDARCNMLERCPDATKRLRIEGKCGTRYAYKIGAVEHDP